MYILYKFTTAKGGESRGLDSWFDSYPVRAYWFGFDYLPARNYKNNQISKRARRWISLQAQSNLHQAGHIACDSLCALRPLPANLPGH